MFVNKSLDFIAFAQHRFILHSNLIAFDFMFVLIFGQTRMKQLTRIKVDHKIYFGSEKARFK